jgi:hypothetical protein
MSEQTSDLPSKDSTTSPDSVSQAEEWTSISRDDATSDDQPVVSIDDLNFNENHFSTSIRSAPTVPEKQEISQIIAKQEPELKSETQGALTCNSPQEPTTVASQISNPTLPKLGYPELRSETQEALTRNTPQEPTTVASQISNPLLAKSESPRVKLVIRSPKRN